MFFASDNTAPVPAAILEALAKANQGYAMGYGNDPVTARAQAAIREVLEAPEAVVHFVSTGTAANSLALSLLTPPWGAVFCEAEAHVQVDECGAPELFTGGAKLIGLPGKDGKLSPEVLAGALASTGNSLHNIQRGCLSLTNVTEAGTAYTPAEIAALTAVARGYGLPTHLDGARFANALVSTGASPAEMTWKAGIDVLSFGGTKNGLMGVEAVVVFDPAKDRELQLRRKRAGHLASKMRYVTAQIEPWLEGGRWLDLAAQANAMAARLAKGLAEREGVQVLHPVEGNLMFVEWPEGLHERLKAAGAVYYPMPAPKGREGARLVCSWSTTEADVDGFLAAF